jgi:ribonuclease VapC
LIVVDTSALMAIMLDEPEAEACAAALLGERDVAISAGTLAEARIVGVRRNLAVELAQLSRDVEWVVDPVTQAVADGVGEVYARWGKGRDPARLNLGDCFAYELAARHDCPLLYVGADFSKTDIKSALSPTISELSSKGDFT